LRLNGFFTIPHFSVLQDDWTHIDLLAVRLGGSVEKVGKGEERIPLRIDDEFLGMLQASSDDTIGLIVEVKSGNEKARVSDVAFDYVKPFFGTLSKLRRIGFEDKGDEIRVQDNHIIVPLTHCLRFIHKRFHELDSIDDRLRGSGRLSKEGSWYLSEEFLSDLLFLRKMEHKTGKKYEF